MSLMSEKEIHFEKNGGNFKNLAAILNLRMTNMVCLTRKNPSAITSGKKKKGY